MAVNPPNPTPTPVPPPNVQPVLSDPSFWISALTSLIAVIAAGGASAGWFNLSAASVTAIDAIVAAAVPILMALYVQARKQQLMAVLRFRIAVHQTALTRAA